MRSAARDRFLHLRTPPPPEVDADTDTDTDADTDTDTDTDADCDPVHVFATDQRDGEGSIDAICGCNFRPGDPSPLGDVPSYYDVASSDPASADIAFYEGVLRCQNGQPAQERLLWSVQKNDGLRYLAVTALGVPMLRTVQDTMVDEIYTAALGRFSTDPDMQYRFNLQGSFPDNVGIEADAHSSISVVQDVNINPGAVYAHPLAATRIAVEVSLGPLPANPNNLVLEIYLYSEIEYPLSSWPLHEMQVLNTQTTTTVFNATVLDDSPLVHPPGTSSDVALVGMATVGTASSQVNFFNVSLEGVVTHELGHAYGLNHMPADQNWAMRPATPPGVRRSPLSETECRAVGFIADGTLNTPFPPCDGTDAP